MSPPKPNASHSKKQRTGSQIVVAKNYSWTPAGYHTSINKWAYSGERKAQGGGREFLVVCTQSDLLLLHQVCQLPNCQLSINRETRTKACFLHHRIEGVWEPVTPGLWEALGAVPETKVLRQLGSKSRIRPGTDDIEEVRWKLLPHCGGCQNCY